MCFHIPDVVYGAFEGVALLTEIVSLADAKERAHGTGDEAARYRAIASHEYTEGPICWVFDPRWTYRLDDPIPMSGKQGLWDVPANVTRQLMEIVS
jgi:hypothetical protein